MAARGFIAAALVFYRKSRIPGPASQKETVAEIISPVFSVVNRIVGSFK